MKINWSIRFKQPAFVLTFCTTVLAFVYTILGMFEVVPPVTENQLTQVIAVVVELLAALGILVDPTSKGVSDTEYVLSMKAPEE